jgi:hypothetical protein
VFEQVVGGFGVDEVATVVVVDSPQLVWQTRGGKRRDRVAVVIAGQLVPGRCAGRQ